MFCLYVYDIVAIVSFHHLYINFHLVLGLHVSSSSLSVHLSSLSFTLHPPVIFVATGEWHCSHGASTNAGQRPLAWPLPRQHGEPAQRCETVQATGVKLPRPRRNGEGENWDSFFLLVAPRQTGRSNFQGKIMLSQCWISFTNSDKARGRGGNWSDPLPHRQRDQMSL
jgi:hypothetical protein